MKEYKSAPEKDMSLDELKRVRQNVDLLYKMSWEELTN